MTNQQTAIISLKDLISKTEQNIDLSYKEMEQAIQSVLDDQVTDKDLGQLLLNLNRKGETADEITAVVNVLLDNAVRLDQSFPHAVDNSGTGGDKSGSFNISTTSAFVMAGAGATVAKHGNKSITSKSGSSDVLEAVGVSLNYDIATTSQQLKDIGISFLYAPQTNPKLGQIMRVRKQLGVPTLFNLIGPLINPVDINHQYVGVYKREMIGVITEVLKRLGRKKVVVANGADHMDEVNLLGENLIAILDVSGEITHHTFLPKDFGFQTYVKDDVKGGDKNVNKEILLDVLSQKATDAQRDTVLLNAAVGLYAADIAESIDQGVDLARESIESGRALEKLNALVTY